MKTKDHFYNSTISHMSVNNTYNKQFSKIASTVLNMVVTFKFLHPLFNTSIDWIFLHFWEFIFHFGLFWNSQFASLAVFRIGQGSSVSFVPLIISSPLIIPHGGSNGYPCCMALSGCDFRDLGLVILRLLFF